MKVYKLVKDVRAKSFNYVPSLKDQTYPILKGTIYVPDLLIQIVPYGVNRVKRMVLHEFQQVRDRAEQIELDDSILERLANICGEIRGAVRESDKLVGELENLINVS